MRGIREESEEEEGDVARTGEVVTVGDMSNTPRLPRSRASAWKRVGELTRERQVAQEYRRTGNLPSFAQAELQSKFDAAKRRRIRKREDAWTVYKKIGQILSEVSPPGWGHTKTGGKKSIKVGGTAAAMKKAKAEGRMPGVKNIFSLMWAMKNRGDKPHYKPGKKGVLKKKYKKKKK